METSKAEGLFQMRGDCLFRANKTLVNSGQRTGYFTFTIQTCVGYSMVNLLGTEQITTVNRHTHLANNTANRGTKGAITYVLGAYGSVWS